MGSGGEDSQTIRCLLCRGVVTFSQEDESRYRDHLRIEHRVHYYVKWIIRKTIEVVDKDGEEEDGEGEEEGGKGSHGIENDVEGDGEEDFDCIDILSNVETQIGYKPTIKKYVDDDRTKSEVTSSVL